ncbi:MAG: aldo/keto reductase [Candidatus Tantalella remota]|nr:aldo/keto reductase [Candidatus Tantalella remota]
MEYKKLGITGLKVSPLGFGCWAMGGHGYGKTDDTESILTVREAIDKGINFFDTSNVYGFGHSEKVLGEALKGRSKDVIIATKFGVNWDSKGKTYKDCSPDTIVHSLHDSLRRLKVDCIPLYQIHWYDGKTPFCDIMETLEKCKVSGKIGHVGCTNFSFDLVKRASSKGRVESLQVNYNILQCSNHEDIVQCRNKLNMGIIAYSVLERGLLSGKFHLASKFGKNDTRSREENFIGKKFKENLKIVDKLKEIGERYGRSPSQVSIRWVLDDPMITCAIIGVKNRTQLVDNMGALDYKLCDEDLKYMNGLADGSNTLIS